MKMLILSGSRNPDGQTAQACKALVAGAEEAGCAADTVFLPGLALQRCRQCDNDGWGVCREGERCIIEDDFAGLVERLRAADVAVFATPVYFGDLSESLRAFLDRLRRVCIHGGKKDRIEGKTAAGVCVAGGGGGGAPYCTQSLERYLGVSGFDVVDMVPVRRQNLEEKCVQLVKLSAWLATAPGSQ